MYPQYNDPNTKNEFSITNFQNIVSKLTIAEVKDTIADTSKIRDLVKSSDDIKAILKQKENILEENRSLALSNLQYEPILLEKKASLADAHARFKEAIETYTILKSKIESHSNRQSPSVILALLQAASLEAEEESERIASSLLNNEMDIEQFIKEYIPKRSLYNERHIKSEKLAQQLNSGSSTSTMNFELRQQTIEPPNAPYPLSFQSSHYPTFQNFS